MKWKRLAPVCLAAVVCAACSGGSWPDDPVSLQAPAGIEHTFTATPALEAEGMYTFNSLRDQYLFGPEGVCVFPLDGETRVYPLEDRFSDGPARYYTVWQGEGEEQVSAVCDQMGRRVTSWESRDVLALGGDILVRGERVNRFYSGADVAREITFTDLTTGEVLLSAAEGVVCAAPEGYFALTVEKPFSGAPEARLLDGETLEVVDAFDGRIGVAGIWDYTVLPDDILLLAFFTEEADFSWDALFLPGMPPGPNATSQARSPWLRADLYCTGPGEVYPGFAEICGDGALLRDEDGRYSVVRLADGETVVANSPRQYLYWSDVLTYWMEGDARYCQCAAAYGEEPVEVGHVSYQGGVYFVEYPDGGLDMLAADGSLMRHFPPADDPAGFVDTLDLAGWAVGRTAEGVTAYGPAGEAFAFPFGVKPVYGTDGVYRFCRWDMRSGDVLVDETGRDLAAGYRSIEWLADFPGGPVLLAKSDRTVSLLTLDGGTLWQKDYLPGGGPYA